VINEFGKKGPSGTKKIFAKGSEPRRKRVRKGGAYGLHYDREHHPINFWGRGTVFRP